jgi:hypothetical protein
MLEDNRAEVKIKTEKLIKKIHQIIGQSFIDNCPQPKLQRVCDIIMNSS